MTNTEQKKNSKQTNKQKNKTKKIKKSKNQKIAQDTIGIWNCYFSK